MFNKKIINKVAVMAMAASMTFSTFGTSVAYADASEPQATSFYGESGENKVNKPTAKDRQTVRVLGVDEGATVKAYQLVQATYGYSFGGHGNRSSNYQQAKRELLDANELRVLDNGKAVFFIRGEYPVLDDKYNLKQHALYSQLGESTGKFYDHGEVKNKILFEKGKKYKLAGRKIDVKVSGGENLKYFTDEEIDSYCP